MMATSLADHVSALLQRAGFTASSPEIVQIRNHNNTLRARYHAEYAAAMDRAAERNSPEWLKARRR